MIRIRENLVKEWLRRMDCPVPESGVARDPGSAASICRRLESEVVIKALVPAGRRGKAGGVLSAADPRRAEELAGKLIGTILNGYPVREVLVERKIDIAREIFLSFVLTGEGFEMLTSSQGGIEVEQAGPENVHRTMIDPARGLTPELAAEAWVKAGFDGGLLLGLARLTLRLYAAFVEADALLLELNPVAITHEGSLCVAGAMMGIDENALFRHEDWAEASEADTLPDNPRERRVAQVDRDIAGGECRYIELDGDIGLLVGGGGAGLYQHDLVLALGGHPANHCVTPPTGSDSRKLRAVIDAILDHPRIGALLVSFNYSQMSRVDIRVRTLLEALADRRTDAHRIPVVVRAFGAGEDEARKLASGSPDVHYLPRGSSLKEACQLVVRLSAERAARSPA